MNFLEFTTPYHFISIYPAQVTWKSFIITYNFLEKKLSHMEQLNLFNNIKTIEISHIAPW